MLLLLLLANGASLYHLFFGDMGIVRWRESQNTYRALEIEKAQLQIDNQSLQKRMFALREDLFYIEGLARERLGMARDGEWIYEFYE